MANNRIRGPWHLLACITALVAVGCSEPEPVSYRIPKETTADGPPHAHGADQEQARPAEMGMTVLPGMAESVGGFETPDMTAPEHWQGKPPGQLRRGSWDVPNPAGGMPADMSVLVFPGDVGGLEANVNRWQQQIGLQPGPLGDIETIEANGHEGVFVRLVGTQRLADGSGPLATLGWIVPVGEGTWFFKMTGSRDHTLAEEDAFRGFIESVRFGSSPTD